MSAPRVESTAFRRFQRWRRSWDAADLWPDVSAGELKHLRREIARVTGTLLSDPTCHAALHVDDDVRPQAAGIAAFTSGMGPLLGHWVQIGRLTTSPEVAGLESTSMLFAFTL